MTTLIPQVKRRNRWQDKRKRQLERLADMRAAKERKRLARGPIEEEPRMTVVRYPNLSWAVRDDLSGHVEWMPLVSVRDAAKRLAVVAANYQPRCA